MKTKALRCAHKGCKKKHKSSTGYCADHVQEMDKQRMPEVKEGRKCWMPKLAEEQNGDY